MFERKFCLVTGAPRSGTTVLGELLSLGPRAQYLYEPMNFHAGDRRVPTYFAVPGANDFSFETAADLLRRIQKLDLHLKSGLWGHESGWRKLRKQLIGGRSRVSLLASKANILATNIIWKDPFAFFSVPYVLEHTDIPVVVTTRPVEGICASFKRLGWGFDLRKLLTDLRDPSLPVSTLDGIDLEDSVQNGAALWSIMQVRLEAYRGRERCRVVDLHDLLTDPVETMRATFAHCNIPFTDARAKEIERRYSRKSSVEVPTAKVAHIKNRNIQSIATYWKKSLEDQDIEVIQRVLDRFGLSSASAPEAAAQTSRA